MQAIPLLVAPALFAAIIYIELGRIIIMTDGEGRALIPKKWMTKIFVTRDVLSFILQGGGGRFTSWPHDLCGPESNYVNCRHQEEATNPPAPSKP
jgi:hypothetical protein